MRVSSINLSTVVRHRFQLEKHEASSLVASRRCELSLAITGDPIRLFSNLKHDFILNWSFDVRGQQVVANDTLTAKKDQLTAKFLGLKLDAYSFFTFYRRYAIIEIEHLVPIKGSHITQANQTIRSFGTPLLNCMSDLALYARRAYAVAIAACGTDLIQ